MRATTRAPSLENSTGPAPSRSDLVVDGTTPRPEAAGAGPADLTVHCDAATFVRLIYGRLDLEAEFQEARPILEHFARVALLVS